MRRMRTTRARSKICTEARVYRLMAIPDLSETTESRSFASGKDDSTDEAGEDSQGT